VRSGSLTGTVQLIFTEEPLVGSIARYLRRCGIGCAAAGRTIVAEGQAPQEVRMELASRNVWVSQQVKAQLEDNLRSINALTAGIQLKNAERQIKQFSEQEESEFVSLQRQYLDLLKRQDELLKEFNEEENLPAKQIVQKSEP
jgi:hypothetical protein